MAKEDRNLSQRRDLVELLQGNLVLVAPGHDGNYLLTLMVDCRLVLHLLGSFCKAFDDADSQRLAFSVEVEGGSPVLGDFGTDLESGLYPEFLWEGWIEKIQKHVYLHP